ncbi:molybdopterin-containing oxidoreductase family protein [Thermodesulforhabdus norvegica]|uniref:Anaerobic selenocysteine-containing dehydrogenase n=1 Tax=Thermodesulforhabdus norvegica TaxID=39841 RepID=A0A1I4VJK4_9BACT|nr:molybdopterin-dependent oxidoreductase [Thermodesulforhabdus norvegica]SFN01454.1 Anaerobic selenocysteine-containing dehydrogenase [Thermodesulforhabdus norvegica]
MTLRLLKTHCGRMDHGGCPIMLEIDDSGIRRVHPDPGGWTGKPYLCAKAFGAVEKLNHPARLTYPIIRTGKRGENRWRRASWDEALGLIAENLDRVREKHGARAVAFCQGMPKGLEHFVLIRLANLFGSPNVVAVQDVCHAPREVTGLHTCGFYPVADFRHHSEVILLWGSNPVATNEEGLMGTLLLDRLAAGTKLIVVDPMKTRLAKRAELYLPVKPGRDALLALAMLNVIVSERLYDEEFVSRWTHGFEELATHVEKFSPHSVAPLVGVDSDLIENAARLYASAKPAAVAWGNAIEQTPNNFNACRALICLMAICGNLDVPGGNVEALDPPVARLGDFVKAKKIPDKPRQMVHAHFGTIPRLMTVPPAFFRKAVCEEIPYPIKAAYMQCTNPLLTWADGPRTLEAIMKLDFLAVSDIYLTPTALYADVVLPAATQFEFNDIGHYGLGHGFILARPRAVDPPGECWPDIKILNELGRRLTPSEYWYDDHEALLDEVLKPSGLDYNEFVQKGILRGEEKFRKYLDKGFRTPTGKVELLLSRADELGLPALPVYDDVGTETEAFPLLLTCRKDPFYLHSSYRWVEVLRKHSPEPFAFINPETAKKYGISSGDPMYIETAKGSVVQKARYHSGVREDVVVAAYGWWFPEDGPEKGYRWTEANLNWITDCSRPGKEFGTPLLRGIPCRIRPVD